MLDDTTGEQLRAWVQARTNLATFWGDQPESYVPDDYVILRMGDFQRVGQDGVRWTYDDSQPEGQEMVPTVVGQREFTLSIEARAWSQELSQTAEVVLSRLEMALQLPAFQQLLLELNLGLISTGTLRQDDRIVDDRVQSGALIDIRFATSIQLSDADDGQSYIETAEVETTLQGGVSGDIVLTDTVGDV